MSEPITIHTQCPVCHGTGTVKVDGEAYMAWKQGALIQDALPELSKEEREMLKTGTCQKCWDDMFNGPLNGEPELE